VKSFNAPSLIRRLHFESLHTGRFGAWYFVRSLINSHKRIFIAGQRLRMKFERIADEFGNAVGELEGAL